MFYFIDNPLLLIRNFVSLKNKVVFSLKAIKGLRFVKAKT